jgi:antitoxin component YwqK of YwqJK toxin-antitoxin module
MKALLFILISICSISASAQEIPDYGLNKIRINDPDKSIVAETIPIKDNPAVKSNLFYYWYSANLIHSTQGGYSGKLLNGQYSEFYLNKNLKVQGAFKTGLKNGVWKNWNSDGTINKVQTWKNGVLIPDGQPSFWQKLNIFKRKQNALTDTVNKKNGG